MRAHVGNTQKAHVAIPRNFIDDFGLIFPLHFLTFVTYLCINVFGCFGLKLARRPKFTRMRKPAGLTAQKH